MKKGSFHCFTIVSQDCLPPAHTPTVAWPVQLVLAAGLTDAAVCSVLKGYLEGFLGGLAVV